MRPRAVERRRGWPISCLTQLLVAGVAEPALFDESAVRGARAFLPWGFSPWKVRIKHDRLFEKVDLAWVPRRAGQASRLVGRVLRGRATCEPGRWRRGCPESDNMILCADDFGSAADVDQCIVTLAEQRKISAVAIQAALLNGSTAALNQLRQQPTLDLGLQFVLTAPARPDSVSPSDSLCAQGCFLPPGKLLERCLRQRVSVPEVRNQLAAQYQSFVTHCGRPPDFLASHLHVHQFPRIREGLLELAAPTWPIALAASSEASCSASCSCGRSTTSPSLSFPRC